MMKPKDQHTTSKRSVSNEVKSHSAIGFISSCENQTQKLPPQAPPFLRIFFQDRISISQRLSYRSIQTLRLISAWITLYGFAQSKIWCQRMFNEFQRGNHQHRSEFNFTLMPASASWAELQPTNLHFMAVFSLICIWIFMPQAPQFVLKACCSSTGFNILYRYLIFIQQKDFLILYNAH